MSIFRKHKAEEPEVERPGDGSDRPEVPETKIEGEDIVITRKDEDGRPLGERRVKMPKTKWA